MRSVVGLVVLMLALASVFAADGKFRCVASKFDVFFFLISASISTFV